MPRKPIDVTPEMKQILVKAASQNKVEAAENQALLTKALKLPLREGILYGDIISNIFKMVPIDINTTAEFPLHYLTPGTEGQYVAYTLPNAGVLPQKLIEGDYVQLPIYTIGASITMLLKYARDARWDVVGDAMENLQKQFVKKKNDDGFHTLLAAAVDRNIVVYDANANAGQFTKRVVSQAKNVMARNGGGNTTSLNRGNLTDVMLSVECLEDIRNWGVDQVDEITRREIYTAGDGKLNRVFQVNLIDLVELGEGEEYQQYYLNELGGTLPSGDVELMVGLDLSKDDSFVMPVRGELEIYEDEHLFRSRMMGWYGYMDLGFGVLDRPQGYVDVVLVFADY